VVRSIVIVMSISICLSVCLSVHSHSLNPTLLNFTKFIVHVACCRGLALMTSWSTSSFMNNVSYHGLSWARIKHDVIFRRSSPGGGTSWTLDKYIVWSSSSEYGTGAKSAIYDCFASFRFLPLCFVLWSLLLAVGLCCLTAHLRHLRYTPARVKWSKIHASCGVISRYN